MPAPAAALSKLLTRIRARGIGDVASGLLALGKAWLSSGETLIVFCREPAPEGDRIEGLTFRAARPDDAERYAQDVGTDTAETFAARLTEETSCFIVEDETRLLHTSWVTTGAAWTMEIDRYIVPPPTDAYIYESFTRPEARGRGIYPFALRNIAAWGAAGAKDRLWVAVESGNAPSIRAVTKAGFEEAFRLPYRRRFGKIRIDPATGPSAAVASSLLSETPPR